MSVKGNVMDVTEVAADGDYTYVTNSTALYTLVDSVDTSSNNWAIVSTENANSELYPQHLAFIEFRIADWLWIICVPVLLLVGHIGNVFSVLVMRRKNMIRGTMAVYMTTLAVSDNLALNMGLVRPLIIALTGVDIRNSSAITCKLHLFLVYYTLTDTSAWTLVLLTTERSISLWKPHSITFTRKTAGFGLAVIGICMCCLNSHFLYGHDVDSSGYCRSTEAFYTFTTTVWSWIGLNVLSLMPFVFLIIGNTIIVYCVRRSQLGLAQFRTEQRNENTNSSKPMLKTVLVLNLVFLASTLPISILDSISGYLLHDVYDIMSEQQQATFRLINSITMLLLYTNNAINLYLYCLSGSIFRREFFDVMSRLKRRRPPNIDARQRTSPQ